MRNPFLVSIKCPECGGPVRYPEGAYTFKCGYCASVLRTQTEGLDLKYVIRNRLGKRDLKLAVQKIIRTGEHRTLRTIRGVRTFYKPFWHFKGMIYSAMVMHGNNEVIAKTWHHSFQGNVDFMPSFYSLGTRTEVLTIESYDSALFGEEGVVLPMTVDKGEAEKQALKMAEKNLDLSASSYRGDIVYKTVTHYDPEGGASQQSVIAIDRSFTDVSDADYKKTYLIGERFFIIYYPFVQVVCEGVGGVHHSFMLDGVHGGLLDEREGRKRWPGGTSKKEADTVDYHLDLLTHRCENCGHDLASADFDTVYYCDACFRLWLLEGGRYRSLRVKVYEPARPQGLTFIPFWKFTVELSSKEAEVAIEKVGDLGQMMKMADLLLRDVSPDGAVAMYIPAIVTRNAGAVVKLGARITQRQKDLPVSPAEEFPFKKVINASLPEKEAEEMLEVMVFSVMGRADLRARKFYKDLQITVRSKEIVWYPFEEKGNYYIDHFHNHTFSKRSMDVNVY